MINKTGFLWFLPLLMAITACTPTTDSSLQPGEKQPPTSTSESSKTIFFPRQKKTDGEWAAMDALARGTLVLVDKCIRLDSGETLPSELLIWPPDFNFTVEDDTIKILNAQSEIVASIGDRVQMSGGEINLLSQLDASIQEQVPSQCPGPYWVMGYEFTTIIP